MSFNSRSRMGSDKMRLAGWARKSKFQFTLPHGERHYQNSDDPEDVSFNSRSRMGSDTSSLGGSLSLSVSIHAPAWGATRAQVVLENALAEFQFTLPHGERQGVQGRVRRRGQVSIHAPAWGATCASPHRQRLILVSIHASAWGATRSTPRRSRWLGCFNSRSRMGSDRTLKSHITNRRVSIHAPAWGATFAFSLNSTTTTFQFTLPHGERPHTTARPAPSSRFNSRSRMGSDGEGFCEISRGFGFNSRSRMGSDTPGPFWGQGKQVSIHAPAWGATSRGMRRMKHCKVSIHAPAWGATGGIL